MYICILYIGPFRCTAFAANENIGTREPVIRTEKVVALIVV